MVKAAVLLILFIVSFVQCNSLFKRSKIHDQFPDYSLRYKYPTICNTASKQVIVVLVQERAYTLIQIYIGFWLF